MEQLGTIAALAMLIIIPTGVEIFFATRPQNGIGLVMPIVTLFFAGMLAVNAWQQGGGTGTVLEMLGLGLIPTLITGGIYLATAKIRSAKRNGTYRTRAQRKQKEKKKKESK